MDGELTTTEFLDGIELEDSEAKELSSIEDSIQGHRRIAIETLIAVGGELNKANEILSRHRSGVFTKWMELRAGISRRTGYNYMAAHAKFGHLSRNTLAQFHREALYLLAKDDIPTPAIAQAIAQAESGQLITVNAANSFIEENTITERNSVIAMPDECPVCRIETDSSVNEWIEHSDDSYRCVHCGHIYGESAAVDESDEIDQEELESEQRREAINRMFVAVKKLSFIVGRIDKDLNDMTLRDLFTWIENERESMAAE